MPIIVLGVNTPEPDECQVFGRGMRLCARECCVIYSRRARCPRSRASIIWPQRQDKDVKHNQRRAMIAHNFHEIWLFQLFIIKGQMSASEDARSLSRAQLSTL
jgi:hypothetical protein